MTEQKYAHELAPEPAEEAPLIEHVRYALARAVGFWRRFMDNPPSAGRGDYVMEAIYSGQMALLLVALHEGLDGVEAFRWMQERAEAESLGEWLYECGVKLGLDVDAIRAYEAR